MVEDFKDQEIIKLDDVEQNQLKKLGEDKHFKFDCTIESGKLKLSLKEVNSYSPYYYEAYFTIEELYRMKDFFKAYKVLEDIQKNIKALFSDKTTILESLEDDSQIKIHIESKVLAEHVDMDFILERKTVEDFSKSITDKRLYQQAKELVNNCRKPLMIIEGENIYHTFLHPNAIRGALTAIAIDFRIPIIQTQNETDTAFMIKRIAIREQEKDNKKPVSVRTQTKPVTLPEQQLFITESLPGIGPVSAKKLLTHFKTVKNVVNASKKELKEVEGIGEKTATNIIDVTNREFKE